MFIVTVDFLIKPEHLANFMVSMLANAKASLQLEEACLQFDVCVDKEDDCRIFLYEVYRRVQDFDFHLKTNHFLQFAANSAEQVSSKTVRSFERAGV